MHVAWVRKENPTVKTYTTGRRGEPRLLFEDYIYIRIGFAMAKAAFNKKRTLFTSTLDLELKKKLVKCYIWNLALCGAETWTLRAVDLKHLETFEMWCWRRMETISWTEHVRNEKVLLTVKEQSRFECAVSGVRHPQHTQTCSNSSTIAADSSEGVTNTRCCRYSSMLS
jgi:hypothetical protein